MGLRKVHEHERLDLAPSPHQAQIAGPGGGRERARRRYHAKMRKKRKEVGESDLFVRLTSKPGLYSKMKYIAQYNKEKGRTPNNLNAIALEAITTWIDREYAKVPEPELYPVADEELYEED